MIKNRTEVIDIMEVLFDEDVVMENYEHEIAERAEQRGIERGRVNVLIQLFKEKKISAQEGADYLNMSVDEFLKLV